MRIGGGKYVTVDTRIIAASNKDLALMIKEGKFRQDLYFRLKVLTLKLPSLRDRKGDILLLVFQMVRQWALRLNRRIDFCPEALRLLEDYKWPGNVRELKNVVEFVSVAGKGRLISADLLTQALEEERVNHELISASMPVEEADTETEQVRIDKALRACGGSKVRAAKMLGIHRSSLYRKLKKC
jgi:transcriptional regulator with PAS, ATPase and Fis domain